MGCEVMSHKAKGTPIVKWKIVTSYLFSRGERKEGEVELAASCCGRDAKPRENLRQ